MTSVFDPNTFGAMTFEGEMSTEAVPVPVGDWTFIIKKHKITAWQSKDDPNNKGLKVSFTCSTSDSDVVQKTEREENILTYEVMLDLKEDGGLDFGKGKNVRLGRLREATGLNEPGMRWSFDSFDGRTFLGKVGHDPYEGRLIAKIKDVVLPK